MYLLMIFLHILLVFLINILKCSYDDKIYFVKNFTENYELKNSKLEYYINNENKNILYELFNENKTSNTKLEKFLFGNIKFLKNGTMLRNIPREDYTIKDTFLKYNDYTNENKNESWPNADYNNYNKSSNTCECFISIIGFELDDKENIYLLDEGNQKCPIILYKFNSEGKNLENFTILENNSLNMFLTDLVIDKINDYAYISYSYISDSHEIEVGFLAKDLDNPKEEIKNIILSGNKIKYDEHYNIKNYFIENNFPNITKKLISITLSCDGDILFFCPLLSRMIYSISTNKLRKQKIYIIDKSDINEGYKDDASSAIIYSNVGNLYLTALEKNIIYMAGQIDKDFSIFDYRGIDEIKGEPGMGWPTKMSITDGTLYIISKNIINDKEDENKIKLITSIYKTSIDKENSYVYQCAGLIYEWDNLSCYIWIIFLFVVCFVLVFVCIGNQEDININKKNI